MQENAGTATSSFLYKTAVLSACGELFIMLEKATSTESRQFLREQYNSLQQLRQNTPQPAAFSPTPAAEAAAILDRVLLHMEHEATEES